MTTAVVVTLAACGGGETTSGEPDARSPADAYPGPDAGFQGDIPDEVAEIIVGVCHECHSSPLSNDAPMPLEACNDLFAASVFDSSRSVIEVLEERINDVENPMPPSGQLPEGDLDAMNDWLTVGAGRCN